ncbi:MAG TPA: PucR family transcriptional regulator [Nakamurella sp.]
MALSVRALAAQRDLGLRVLAGALSDEPITWVHVSELVDPTPFLSGGELLLTTGLFVRDEVDLPAYVDRLCATRIRGLGFGVGLGFEQVPAELAAAADRTGLPLLEVPRGTPFIALSRAVSNALAADEYAAVTRTFTAQQELTRAALAADTPGRLIRLLARKVDGWVALVDERGAPLAVGGDSAAAMVPAVAVEVARLREHRGSVGAAFDIDLSGGADTVSLQPVGAGSRRRAYLAVGRPGPLSAADRHLVNAAVMLLTLGFEKDAVAPGTAAAVRSAVLEIALNGHVELARSVAARLGAPLPDDPMVVLIARPTAAAPAPAIADRPAVAGAFAALLDDELVVVAPLNATDSVTADLVGTGMTVGVSGAAHGADLAGAVTRAEQAADAAAERGKQWLTFDAIASSGITQLWNPEQATVFAESLLAPLVEHDRAGRGDLVASLRTWLAHHGQWDPAAAALRVHRHTLRRRIGLVGRLLGRDLDSPTVRSELWLASGMIGRGGR